MTLFPYTTLFRSKELRGILGLSGYYRKFIKNYAHICKPLYELLRKNNFFWNSKAEEAFLKLKQIMSSAPVLALPDFSKPFILETDASGYGIGDVLTQGNGPIAYLSKVLGVKNSALSTYEKEFLAVLMAIEKWKHYLQGHHFIVRTDQKSLKHLC